MTTLDLSITSGDDLILEITVKEKATGEPVLLTGTSASFVIAPKRSKRILVTKATGSGVTVSDPDNGVLEVELLAADTAALMGTYSYELQLVDVTGNRTTPLRGDLAIVRDLIET
jgi:hypothetical protein